eukprot:COSAG02_NODE_8635_length_2497_cov_2.471030_1_plen_171_part_00
MAMARFFQPNRNSYEMAEDKDAWSAETLSGKYDWYAPLTNEEPPADAGSMCPVEHGGLLPQSDPPIAHTQATCYGKAMLEAKLKRTGNKPEPEFAGLCVACKFLDGNKTYVRGDKCTVLNGAIVCDKHVPWLTEYQASMESSGGGFRPSTEWARANVMRPFEAKLLKPEE